MDVEKILIVDDEEEFSAIARLVELGRQKSYVTLDDILHFFPEAEQDVEQLEEAFSALLSADQRQRFFEFRNVRLKHYGHIVRY